MVPQTFPIHGTSTGRVLLGS